MQQMYFELFGGLVVSLNVRVYNIWIVWEGGAGSSSVMSSTVELVTCLLHS